MDAFQFPFSSLTRGEKNNNKNKKSVYNAQSLQNSWYVIAGNHDHYGNVTGEVEYSKTVGTRWTFPSLYHSHSFTSKDAEQSVTLDLIMLDTVDLASLSHVQSEHEPGYFAPLPEKARAEAQTQWDWLETQLSASTAKYLIVAGHYPVYSVCEHGSSSTLITNLKPLLEKVI